MAIKPWPLVGRKTISRNRIFSLVERRASSPVDGRPRDFYVLESVDWVNVLAITRDRRAVMVRQFRQASREMSLEFPGGLVDQGEEPKTAALREIAEETGYVPGETTLLGRIKNNPALIDNTCHIYLVENAVSTGRLHFDEAEDLETLLVPLTDLPRLVAEGQITHSVPLSVISLYACRYGWPADGAF